MRAWEGKKTDFPLAEFAERMPGGFGEGVLGKLNETDLKLFSCTNETCRDAVRMWKKNEEEAEKTMKFKASELSSSMSLLEWAWERIPFSTVEWNWSKERFIAIVVGTVVNRRGKVRMR